VPLPVYTTIYNTIVNHVTNYVVTKYRVVSEIVTELTVDYYDPDVNTLYTSITYPTYYLKAIYTKIVGVETRVAQGAQAREQRSPQTVQPPAPPRMVTPPPSPVGATPTRAGLIVAT
jgi:hypothetical protein